MLAPIEHRIAVELGVRPSQVAAAVQLLDEGATVPFIARYRKEVTDGLDDTQLRELESRLGYLRELEDRRGAVLKSIEEQGKLTPELAVLKAACDDCDEFETLEEAIDEHEDGAEAASPASNGDLSLLERENISSFHILAHDYGVSVAQVEWCA